MFGVSEGPWPWYVAGPLIGLMVPLMILLKRRFGISTSLQRVCAAAVPKSASLFDYDWRSIGGWNVTFALGVALGGTLAALALPAGDVVAIAAATREALTGLGLSDMRGLAPAQIFSWQALGTWPGFMSMVVGGFLVGFGARVAGGCTSGHAISGIAELRAASVVTVVGFFIGGLTITYLARPALLAGLQ